LKLGTVKRAASAVVVCSNYLQKALEEAGFSSHKIVRVYNGIEADRFAVLSPGSLRAELGCSNGTRLVGMVANVRESKGYEYFIRAARLVTDSMPQVRFVAIGEVDVSIGSRLSSLQRELGLDNQLSFLGFRRDLARLLGDLDVFVLSSVSEGFSLATAEAMAAGRPVIVTRSGGPEEVIEDGVTGFLVPRQEPHSLAAKICEVLRNPTLAATLGQSAKAAVETKFGLAKMVQEYTRVYERCLSG
jgi:glycosyltransferase involved in cell wall biosynthesis